MRHLKNPNKSVVHYPRMQKISLEQSLTLAYILCLYILHRLYILEEDLGLGVLYRLPTPEEGVSFG